MDPYPAQSEPVIDKQAVITAADFSYFISLGAATLWCLAVHQPLPYQSQ
jgi:hypothetical protein